MTTIGQRMRHYREEYEEHLLRDMDRLTEKLEDVQRENEELRALVADVYERFHGVVFDDLPCDTKVFDDFEQRLDEFSIGYDVSEHD